MLFTTTLGIIDFFPIAGSWGMAGPWPPWTMVDDSWRATWGDPVAISEPSDSGRQGTWYCLQVAGCCRMLQDVAGCCRMLQVVAGFLQNSSVSWIPVWPGALNFGDAVRCQTGYMQVAKAGNRQQNIAQHNESQPMETRLQLRTWRSMKNRSDFGIWRFGGDGLFCQLFLQIEAAVPWHFGS